MGEVSGEKMTAALDLACADNEKGILTSAVILLETGGVRLQEANLGLAAIAETHGLHSGAEETRPGDLPYGRHGWLFWGHVARRRARSYVVMTREARLGNERS